MRKSKKMLSRVLLGAFAAMTVTAMACNKKSAEENPSESAAPVEVVEVPELEGYTLLWHDEFSGAAMDESIWSYDPHEPGWTNEELQEYTTSTENVFTRDGKMVLKAIKTTDENGKPQYETNKYTNQISTDTAVTSNDSPHIFQHDHGQCSRFVIF